MLSDMPTTSNLEMDESFEENSLSIGQTTHTDWIEELEQDRL